MSSHLILILIIVYILGALVDTVDTVFRVWPVMRSSSLPLRLFCLISSAAVWPIVWAAGIVGKVLR